MAEIPTVARVGHEVPNFELETYDPVGRGFGKTSLEELKKQGKWTILFFYPADFTFVCATEFAALAADYAKFKELGAEVITVSTDTPFVHLAWQEHEGELADVKYPMGADRTGAVSRLFGVLDESSGNALRGTFIISPDGVLMNAEVNFFNMGRNVNELMRKFRANLYLSKHGDEACPAQWEEGSKTLKPGADLVGKVHQALR
ncbi:MAG: redoxin domain-containing protein [Candidatus Eisenbacteria bacterium]|nr:redoxin domain-containing protein [Candidatus Latescibacterota bacterium]MBD3302803.1 redoxin domain-containing protein [Candidatus Eisenbacteria bacterium]